MAEERREVVARLTVEKGGEEGAFKETAEEVRDLKSEAQGAAPAVEQLGEASAEGAESVDDLGRSAGGAVDKLANVASKTVAVVAAFKAGWEAGKLLREGLNWLTDGGFDDGVQSLLSSVLRLDEGLDSAADASLRMQNAQRILKAQGIDPTGLSLAELDKKLEEVSRKKYDAAKADEDLAKADEKWAEKLGISEKALDAAGTKLAEFIERFRAANDQLSDQDLAAIFGEQIQDILDGFEKLGIEAPAKLRQLASSFNVLSTAAEKEHDKTVKAIESMLDKILGRVDTFTGTLEQQAEIIRGVFSQLAPDEIAFGTEGFDAAKKILQEYIAESRRAGQQIPKDIADQAAALGILVAAYEVAEAGASSFAGRQNETAAASTSSAVAFDRETRSLTNLKEGAEQTSVEFDRTTGTLKNAGAEAEKSTVSWDKVSGTLKNVSEAQRSVGEQARDAGDSIKDGGTRAAEGAKALEEAASAGKEAGSGLSAAKDAAEGLGDSAKSGAEGVTALGNNLGGIEAKAKSAATGLEALKATDLSGLVAQLAAVNTALDQMPAKAAAAKTALAAIDADGAAG